MLRRDIERRIQGIKKELAQKDLSPERREQLTKNLRKLEERLERAAAA